MATDFRYWAPKAGATSPIAAPSDIQVITHSPVDGTSSLPSTSTITPVEFTRAVYETGYGPTMTWGGCLLLPPSDHGALLDMLDKRLSWLLTCLEAKDGLVCRTPIAWFIESSEWGNVSYYAGQLGARLAADRWLPPGRRVTRALHASAYASSTFVSTGAQVSLIADGRKIPDLLVEDETGAWHIFEAKGGGKSYKWKAITKALEQLDSIKAVGTALPPPMPASSVCSYTLLLHTKDSPTEVSFDVVDPPVENADDGTSLLVLPEIAELSAAVGTRELLQRRSVAQTRKVPGLDIFDSRETGVKGVYAVLPEDSLIHKFEPELALFEALLGLLRRSPVPRTEAAFERLVQTAANRLANSHRRFSDQRRSTMLEAFMESYTPGLAVSRAGVYELVRKSAYALGFQAHAGRLQEFTADVTAATENWGHRNGRKLDVSPSSSGAVYVGIE